MAGFGPEFRLTVRERILLHLMEHAPRERGHATVRITQPGIAAEVGIERRHVLQYVRPLAAEGLVVEERAWVQGARQRRKVYRLTPRGHAAASRLRNELHALSVEVELDDGGRQRMALEEAARGPFKGISLLDLLRVFGTHGYLPSPRILAETLTASLPKAPPRPFLRPSAKLVDRVPEMARLRQVLTDLRAGRGRVLMITGSAGIGKTRLATELLALAADEGCLVLVGQGAEGKAAPPLGPWIEALRGFAASSNPQVVRGVMGPHAGVLARILPDLRAWPGELPTTGPPEVEQFQLFGAITQVLIDASIRGPVVVCLDDLHFADEATARLLAYASRNTASAALLLLGCYRPEDLSEGGALEAALFEMNRARRLETLRLQELRGGDVEGLIANTVGADRVDPKLLSVVGNHAGGNPFFIEELVRSLQEEGHLAVADGTVVWRGGAVRLPESVRHVIARRLARLSNPAQDVLLQASVLGPRFRPEVLAKLSGVGQDAVVNLLEEALKARLVREEPAGVEVAFGDEVVRESLYESISHVRRQRYHARVADILAAMPGVSAEELAYHYSAAAMSDSARPYLEAAGDESVSLGAFHRAADRFSQALSSVPADDHAARRRLLTKLGNAHSGAGRLLHARDAYVEARDLADHPQERARIGVRLTETLMELWDAAAVHEELGRTLPIVGEAETADAARAHNLYAYMLQDMDGRYEESIPAAERALEIAKAAGDRGQVALAIELLACGHAMTCRWDEAARRASDLARSVEQATPGVVMERLFGAAILHVFFLVDYARALNYLDQVVGIAERIGNDRYSAWGKATRALALWNLGRWDEAEDWLRRGLAIMEDSEECRNQRPAGLAVRAIFAGHRGDIESAERDLLAAVDSPEWHEPLHTQPWTYANLAWVHVEAGNRERARGALQNAFEIIDRHPGCGWCSDLPMVIRASAEAVAPNGDSGRFDGAVCWVRSNGSPFSRARIAAIGARWVRLHGMPSEDGLGNAEAHFRGISNPFELATTLDEHGRTLLALGRKGEALDRLREALDIFQTLGAARRARGVLEELET